MSLKTILYAGLAVASLCSPALVTSAQASDDSYWCNDHRCYDDQADETRRLNRLQAQHPGMGLRAVPGYHGPDYDDGDDDDRDSNGYNDRDDDRDSYGDRDDDYRGYHHDNHDGYGRRDDDRGYGDQDDDDDNQPDTDDDDDDNDNGN